jgi:hypothetical protein
MNWVHREIYRRNGYGDGLRCMMQEGGNGLGDRQGVLRCAEAHDGSGVLDPAKLTRVGRR